MLPFFSPVATCPFQLLIEVLYEASLLLTLLVIESMSLPSSKSWIERNVQIRTVFLEGLLRRCFFLPFLARMMRERERAARDRLVRLINAATADRNLDWRNGEGKREVGRQGGKSGGSEAGQTKLRRSVNQPMKME